MSSEYVLPLYIAATISFITIAGTNALVIYLASTKKDSKTMVISLHLFLAVSFLQTTVGWITMTRVENFNAYAIQIYYGPGSSGGTNFCNFLNSSYVYLKFLRPLLITSLLLVRALLINNFRVNFIFVFINFNSIFVVTLPMFLASYSSYDNDFTLMGLTDLLTEEISQNVYDISIINRFLDYLQALDSILPFLSFLIIAILRTLIARKLKKLENSQSKGQREIYEGYSSFISVSILLEICLVLASYSHIEYRLNRYFRGAKYLISLFSYPLASIPIFLQTIASIIFIPYIRKTFFNLFKSPSRLVYPPTSYTFM